MPREFPRSRRIGEHIGRVLSDVIRTQVRDPRVHGVVITHVRVAPDLSTARIHYTSLDGTRDPRVQEGLERAAGFLRTQLARELDTRTVPELRFSPDAVVEQGRRLDRLIDEAMGKHPGAAGDDTPGDSGAGDTGPAGQDPDGSGPAGR